MTRRVPLDDEQECAFWRTDASIESSGSWRVLVGHADEAIGASLSLLLTLRHYQVIHATRLSELRCYAESWRPHALLLDTRLDAASGYSFVASLRNKHPMGRLLIVAMSNIYPLDSVQTLKAAGFDGHVRRPCSVWRVTDLLDCHFCRR